MALRTIHRNSPIGVFDSGMGGLSVWRELRHALPGESLIYYGDGANCPYGEKPDAEVVGYIRQGVGELVGRGVKMVVLACNTATMLAIKELREKYDIPFVGMEPAVKPAVASTASGVVGVLATRASLNSGWFRELTDKYSGQARILAAEGEGFVRAVENDAEDTIETRLLVQKAVRPMLEEGADRIVLGCTHYPFLRDEITKVIGHRGVGVIDSAPAIVRRVEWLLDENGLRAEPGHEASYEFMTAGDAEYLRKLENKARRIL